MTYMLVRKSLVASLAFSRCFSQVLELSLSFIPWSSSTSPLLSCRRRQFRKVLHTIFAMLSTFWVDTRSIYRAASHNRTAYNTKLHALSPILSWTIPNTQFSSNCILSLCTACITTVNMGANLPLRQFPGCYAAGPGWKCKALCQICLCWFMTPYLISILDTWDSLPTLTAYKKWWKPEDAQIERVSGSIQFAGGYTMLQLRFLSPSTFIL